MVVLERRKGKLERHGDAHVMKWTEVACSILLHRHLSTIHLHFFSGKVHPARNQLYLRSGDNKEFLKGGRMVRIRADGNYEWRNGMGFTNMRNLKD